MNKAEEQYLYQWGRVKAQSALMGWSWPQMDDFIKHLKAYCKKDLGASNVTDFVRGMDDYHLAILHAIDCNVITDWPSFVTYMTGETYE